MKFIKITILIISFIIFYNDLLGQNFYNHNDFLIKSKSINTKDSISLSTWAKAYQIVNVEFPIILGTIVAKNSQDKMYRDLRNDLIPNFTYKYADYLQYAPAAALLIIKLSGVKGKSSWDKMLTADAFSILLTAGLVNGLKYTTNVYRPDNSKNNSFPSGHTATAFMTATMLHIEYGDVNKWISIGGYVTAACVGVSRIMENRHWLSDVLAGAGFGILSAEIGYLISDAIYKKSKPSHSYLYLPYELFDNPSYIGLYYGFFTPLYKELLNDNIIELKTGSRAGIEGAWFVNKLKYFGIGGKITVFSTPIYLNHLVQNVSLYGYSFDAGVYFNYPLTMRWQIGSKLILGIDKYKPCAVNENIVINDNKVKMSYGTGLTVKYKMRDNFVASLFADYDMMSSIKTGKKKINAFSYGICFAIDL